MSARRNAAELLVFGNPPKRACGKKFRKPASKITDRAARYRANSPGCAPSGKHCIFCGRKNPRDVHHVDGNEKNTTPENLSPACRPCNVTIGNVMRAAGLGKKTRQFNPSGGAQTLAQWITAVLSMKGESDQMPVAAAVDLVHSTPASRRSQFAKQIWQKRRRGRNPGELLIFGNPKGAPKVETYRLMTAGGRSIRKATRVVFSDGRKVEFTDRIPKRQAIKQAMAQLGRNPEKFVCERCGKQFTAAQVEAGEYRKHLAEHRQERAKQKNAGFGNHKPGCKCAFCERARGVNPKRAGSVVFKYQGRTFRGKTEAEAKKRALKWMDARGGRAVRKTLGPLVDRRHNPDETQQAVKLFESFHGKDPKEISDKHVSAAMRMDYTALGDLEYLKVITPLGEHAQFNFEGDGVKLASSPDGKQLYCIGGNQNLSQCLDKDSLEKDFIDLGECSEVQYLARKIHGSFEPVSWFHKFGEKTGALPHLAYDKLKKQLFFVGGEYFIDTTAGVSPGIEN
jgi:hypothetical protein